MSQPAHLKDGKRKVYLGERMKIKNPYCKDCGAIRMVSCQVRKGAQGKDKYVIGYWCEFCDGFISDRILRQKMKKQKHPDQIALVSLNRKQKTDWKTYDEIREEFQRIRQTKLKNVKEEYNRTRDKKSEEAQLYRRQIRKLERYLMPVDSKTGRHKRK